LAHYFNPSTTLPEKIGIGAGSYELISSIPTLTSFLSTLSYPSIAEHEETLGEILLGYLGSKDAVTVIGEPVADLRVRLPTISFLVRNRSSKELVETVEAKSAGTFGFRWGSFYSNRLTEGVLGLDKNGVVRVSLVFYNTGE
jgi:selenocysteine lyase/cysteine desulfurase